MTSSLNDVTPWDLRPLDVVCEHLNPEPPPAELIPTVVIVKMSDPCHDLDPAERRAYKGIVYYGFDPRSWYCLRDDERDTFTAWAVSEFGSVQIVTAEAPPPGAHLDGISCPPPPKPDHSIAPELDEPTRAHRDLLRAAAHGWFVPAVRPRSQTKAATAPNGENRSDLP